MGIDRVAKRGRENVAVFASDPAGREPGRDDADVTDAPETSEEREDRLALRVRPLSEARADTGREGRLRVDSVERGEGPSVTASSGRWPRIDASAAPKRAVVSRASWWRSSSAGRSRAVRTVAYPHRRR
ncbi:hypothetical protein ACFQL0_21955 [Haloplanus litoreus]|uniref:hypothetical protein n=1 Tax=Haloplanus litoreus TaxID=767515 RepID=UPI00361CB6C6